MFHVSPQLDESLSKLETFHVYQAAIFPDDYIYYTLIHQKDFQDHANISIAKVILPDTTLEIIIGDKITWWNLTREATIHNQPHLTQA